MVPDSLLGLISAFFAIVGAAFVDGTASWQDTINVAFSRFLISMWISYFVFPNAMRWCLK